jgi:hypothetical protein
MACRRTVTPVHWPGLSPHALRISLAWLHPTPKMARLGLQIGPGVTWREAVEPPGAVVSEAMEEEATEGPGRAEGMEAREAEQVWG